MFANCQNKSNMTNHELFSLLVCSETWRGNKRMKNNLLQLFIRAKVVLLWFSVDWYEKFIIRNMSYFGTWRMASGTGPWRFLRRRSIQAGEGKWKLYGGDCSFTSIPDPFFEQARYRTDLFLSIFFFILGSASWWVYSSSYRIGGLVLFIFSLYRGFDRWKLLFLHVVIWTQNPNVVRKWYTASLFLLCFVFFFGTLKR